MMGVFSKDVRQLVPGFLYKWFAKLDLTLMQNGTSVPQINKGDLTSLPIPVPPLEEQYRVVEYLDSLQRSMDGMNLLQAQTATELDALLPAILDRAFKAEL
jgi:type I restriction enzyme S subunit